jgi:Uma2 family endonuclease
MLTEAKSCTINLAIRMSGRTWPVIHNLQQSKPTLQSIFREQRCPQEIMVRVQSSINCGDHRPEPDLVWSRRMPAKRLRPTHADVLLLIEVSDSSTEQDLGEKARLYAEHGIPEYWVVDVQAEQVHVHRTPSQGIYQSIQSFNKPTLISPHCQPAARLSLAELFDLDS